MSKHLLDPCRAAAASGMEALQYKGPADRGLFHKQAVDIELMVVFGIRNRRLQHLLDILGNAAPGKSQFGQCGNRAWTPRLRYPRAGAPPLACPYQPLLAFLSPA